MDDKIYCDICPGSVIMIMIERLPNHKGHGGKSFRRRRFKCPICDSQRTIFAGGEGDNKIFPERGIDEVNRMFKEEEENRDY